MSGMNRTAMLIAGGLALLLGATACGTSNPTTSSGPAQGTPTSTLPPSDQTVPPPAEADCTLSQLSVTDSDGGAGSTHRSVVVVFANTSSVRCHLAGYPGVAALNASDQQVAQATRTLSGYLAGAKSVTQVTLDPGQSASATVEALAMDATTGNSCTRYAGILVTPPNETHSIKLGWPNDGCGSLQVHPVVPGTTGSAT
jgi:hypothetical protein